MISRSVGITLLLPSAFLLSFGLRFKQELLDKLRSFASLFELSQRKLLWSNDNEACKEEETTTISANRMDTKNERMTLHVDDIIHSATETQTTVDCVGDGLHNRPTRATIGFALEY